jgi:formylmethanofuran dehydrogenase subunit C
VSALVFTLREAPRHRVDLSPLTPDRLRGRGVGEIGKIEMVSGNRRVAAGELFAIAAGDSADIVIRGGTARLDRIGQGMSEGAITVEGDAGAHLGQAMRGGRLRVTGSAGPWAAAALGGGRIEIDGDAGDFIGGAPPGDMRGMGGGLVIVRGNVGERAGDRMRRGIIVVTGNAGGYAGARMIAGSLAILGAAVGEYPGFGMKRGSLMLRRLPSRVLPTFADCGTHDLCFMRLFAHAIGSDSEAKSLRALGGRMRRLVGDAAAGGKAELLVWDS